MSTLTYVQAVVLGVLQGLTEFLPISSSGHLALAQRLMHLEPDTRAMIIFDLAVHVGTLLAVGAVFIRQIRRFAASLVQDVLNFRQRRPSALLITVLGVVASVPTALIGLFLKDTIESAFDRPVWIAAGLLLTGTLLWASSLRPRPRVGWRRFGWWRAVLVGISQGIAIFPGVSRSGATISVALMLGVKRKWAGEFSFFIAAPAIIGAVTLQTRDVAESVRGATATLPVGPLAVGTLAAILSGYLALQFLIVIIRKAKLHYFSYYCWALGLIILLAMR